jgi:hypothetical protein
VVKKRTKLKILNGKSYGKRLLLKMGVGEG